MKISPLAMSLVLTGCGSGEDGGSTGFVSGAGTDTQASETGGGEADSGSQSSESGGTDTATTSTTDGTTSSDGGGDGDADTTASTGDGDGATSAGDGDGDTTGGDGDGGGTGMGTGNGTGNGSGTDTTDSTGSTDTTGTTDTGGSTSTTGGSEDCEAPATHITCDAPGSNPTPFQAVGLNCPGDEFDSTPTTAESFNSPDADAWTLARQFGTSGDWMRTEGEQMLIITTQTIPAPDGNGVSSPTDQLYVPGGDNGNPGGQDLPPPMSPVNGGNPAFTGCDGVNDCSNSLQAQWGQGGGEANDLIWFDFSVDVPGGTYGWTMDFNFITAEYPQWVGTQYNDIFVVWNTSEAFTGNVCFVGDQPCTVTALEAAIEDAANGGAVPSSPKMAGTGMKPNGGGPLMPAGGGATGWYQMQGQSVPGEELELTFALFDMGDELYDTVVLLDNWRWNCEGCDPSIPDDCGVIPIPE